MFVTEKKRSNKGPANTSGICFAISLFLHISKWGTTDWFSLTRASCNMQDLLTEWHYAMLDEVILEHADVLIQW